MTGSEWRAVRRTAMVLGAAGLLVAAGRELRIGRAARPLTDRWAETPVEPRGTTRLGVSFRPLQATALGLEPRQALEEMLRHPFEIVRLAAYWDRIATGPGRFDTEDLDWQVEAAERAGKKIILCVGAVKAFGYPEYFVPGHELDGPLPEGRLVGPDSHRRLADAATAFITRVVRRYRDRDAILAWQVEHEVADPLGMEHSWRLTEDFARREVAAVRAADPRRPVLMNGFVPTSLPVRVQQWWRTRDQGDSVAVAQRLADVVGVDFYPRHGLASLGGLTAYLNGSASPWTGRSLATLSRWATRTGRSVMIAEGQSEPWETVTTPPSPSGQGLYSCLPEHVIGNYSQAKRRARRAGVALDAYLFWGAEYWLLRDRHGDPHYLRAFRRVLDEA